MDFFLTIKGHKPIFKNSKFIPMEAIASQLRLALLDVIRKDGVGKD